MLSLNSANVRYKIVFPMKTFFLNSKNKLLSNLPLVFFFLLGVGLGGALVWAFGDDWFNNDTETPKNFEIRAGGYGYRYINPLLECEIAADKTKWKELTPFKHKVQKLTDDKINSKKATHISVYFRDLNNGPYFGINENEEFSPASLLKVPLLITYLKLAEADPQLLGRKIKNDKKDDLNSIENIMGSKAIEKGKTYTIEELLYMMIVYSDNNAKDLVLGNIDARLLNVPFIDLGIEIPGVRKQEDFMSVKAYASFFRVLFNASYLNREMSEKALGYLTLVEFRKGLVAGVPSNVTVAHKFGERRIIGDKDVKELHDCGIIYYPNYPYLLCVMTRGSDFGDLIDNVKDISYRVYEEVYHQHQNK